MGRKRSGSFTTSQRKGTSYGSDYYYYTDKQPDGAKKSPKALKSQRTLVGGNCVSEGTTINSSRTKPRFGPANK